MPTSKGDKTTKSADERRSSSKPKSVKSRKSSSKNKSATSKKSIGINYRPTSLSSTASMYNLNLGRSFTPKTAAIGGATQQLLKWTACHLKYGKSIYDTVALAITCPKHKKLALSGVDGRNFLPFRPIKSNQSWIAAATAFFRELMPTKPTVSSFTEPVLVDILRLQLPLYFEFIVRVIYKVELTDEECKAKYCADSKQLGWYSMTDLYAMLAKQPMIGPEPLMLDHFQPNQPCREVTIECMLNFQSKGQLLCGTSDDDILAVYGDFLQHVFPSEYMTLDSFKAYLKISKLKMTKHTDALFRAFAFHKRQYLNSQEFILGLAVVGCLSGSNVQEQSNESSNVKKPAIVSSPKVTQFQAEFIFRFYAAKPDHLTEKELDRAASECKITKSEVTQLKRALKNDRLEKSSFTKLLVKHITSSSTVLQQSASAIFQQSTDVSPLDQLRIKRAYPAIHRNQVDPRKNDVIKAKLAVRLLCENCSIKKYTLAIYNMKLSMDGLLYDPVANKQKNLAQMNPARRSGSEHYFSPTYICNQVIDMIRWYAAKTSVFPSKVKQSKHDWTQAATRIKFVKKIAMICNQAAALFARGPRVVKASSPCYVIGDIHGNLADLLTYEQSIWRGGIYLSTASILFLGDYVDRGDYSVECILYLLCLKIIAPERVHMLRGNHETRDLQKEHTFYKELTSRFERATDTVFETFNAVFDVMPLVAVVDESIYCAHGGIPSGASLEQIATIPSPLMDPETHAVANEILWNDPITDREHKDLIAHDPLVRASASQHPDGFLPNTKRNAGCYFNEEALRRFLKENGLSHVIRAHECIPAGFQFHDGGSCITVFSCSHYCGSINEAAVALVHDSQIRVIKVDTPHKL